MSRLTAAQQRQHAALALTLLEENDRRLQRALTRASASVDRRDRISRIRSQLTTYMTPLQALADSYHPGYFHFPDPRVNTYTSPAAAVLHADDDYRQLLIEALVCAPDALRTKLVIAGMRYLRLTHLWQDAHHVAHRDLSEASTLERRAEKITALKNS